MTTVEASTRTRSAREILAWSREILDPALRAAVDKLPASMRRVAAYHLGWHDEHGRIEEAGSRTGKAIRPALTLLTAEALGARADAALPAAVAVELVHNFSLVHDDVMDGDLTRRHRPTAWSVFDVNTAILAGDALLTLAFDVLNTSRHPAAPEAARMLGEAVYRLLDGQSADLAFEQRGTVDLADCVRMSESKTGALVGCACAMGALFGATGQGATGQGATETAAGSAHRLREFGERLGLAFQFADDLLGIWGDPAVTGKPVYSDLANRKKTLPVVNALGTGTRAGADLAALLARADPLSTVELVQAARLIEAAGARAWSREQADAHLAEALAGLPGAGLTRRGMAELTALAELMTSRDH